MHMARRALGDQAIANVCDGAAMVLPSVARLLSAISDGSDAAQAVVSGSLSRIFSPLLLARFTSDLQRLRRDNVQLALEVRRINSARIHQIRTQAGPAEAFAALAELQAPRAASAAAAAHNSGIGAAAGYAKPSLRAGLVRQSHRFSSLLGVACAAPIGHGSGIVSNDGYSDNSNSNNNIYSSNNTGVGAADVLRAAYLGKTDVRVRVDIELNVDMRYRLIGRHLGPSEYDMHNGTTQVIVDDDATRNLMLTLESSPARASNGADSNGADGNGDNVLGNVLDSRYEDEQGASSSSSSSSLPQFEWRVADIDYLISSEMRIQQELEEARNL
ncbi:hypothetical protein LPJ56_001920 [Coemansia sp. RSA 2599]|nr:hypothetical protein LPJ75_001553 [Coemansia sp. RSA 2598]KAJ1826959.1 hypothetical protein LPJ56_001920 [Coemansia sp. RSA 2599]